MSKNLFSLFTYYFTIAGSICQDKSAIICKKPHISLEDLESLLLNCGVHFLTMPSLTNTVAGTLTLPLKETICIVLSFDFSTLQRRRLMHSVLHKLQCLSGLFPLS